MPATKSTNGDARQICFVFDLNKCIGCQTCSVACKVLWHQELEGTDNQWWCSVNTLPGRGTPRDWEGMGGGMDEHGKPILGRLPSAQEFGDASAYNYEEVYASGSRERFRPKQGEPEWAMNWDEDEGAGEFPNSYFYYLPRICNHCSQPACLEACPSDALYKTEDFGLVLRDESRCQGNQNCARACPYKKIYFNPVEKISQHCIGCFPRLEQGVAPSCVRQCPGRAVFVGFREDPDSAVHKLVDVHGVALPHHPEFNTEPNVFYVPPLSPYRARPDGSIDEGQRRIPLEHLEEQFGPRAGEAIGKLDDEMAKRQRGEASELMDLLIGYRWEEFLGPFTRDPAEITW